MRARRDACNLPHVECQRARRRRRAECRAASWRIRGRMVSWHPYFQRVSSSIGLLAKRVNINGVRGSVRAPLTSPRQYETPLHNLPLDSPHQQNHHPRTHPTPFIFTRFGIEGGLRETLAIKGFWKRGSTRECKAALHRVVVATDSKPGRKRDYASRARRGPRTRATTWKPEPARHRAPCSCRRTRRTLRQFM